MRLANIKIFEFNFLWFAYKSSPFKYFCSEFLCLRHVISMVFFGLLQISLLKYCKLSLIDYFISIFVVFRECSLLIILVHAIYNIVVTLFKIFTQFNNDSSI